jgi:hypothetical protein
MVNIRDLIDDAKCFHFVAGICCIASTVLL